MFEGHADMAKELGAPLGNDGDKPIVNDGGFATRKNGLLTFESFTTSCKVAGGQGDARAETYRLARERFGTENVFTY